MDTLSMSLFWQGTGLKLEQRVSFFFALMTNQKGKNILSIFKHFDFIYILQ